MVTRGSNKLFAFLSNRIAWFNACLFIRACAKSSFAHDVLGTPFGRVFSSFLYHKIHRENDVQLKTSLTLNFFKKMTKKNTHTHTLTHTHTHTHTHTKHTHTKHTHTHIYIYIYICCSLRSSTPILIKMVQRFYYFLVIKSNMILAF